ncbi:Protein of unknown function [Lactobacillus equicursoris DSM 19284 = JCM 14600 = CIP 110162]|nr:Protein of unknown function [Lactobacillus equicursoris DSM 19284 = JCM 14600 = CIP 110162]
MISDEENKILLRQNAQSVHYHDERRTDSQHWADVQLT